LGHSEETIASINAGIKKFGLPEHSERPAEVEEEEMDWNDWEAKTN